MRDPGVIRRWWATWPDANVGIVTGAASGIVALDVDPRNGGDEALDALVRRYGRLPITATVITGGGGRHVLLAHPGRRVPSTPNALGRGVDVRGDGGQVVAPPSRHRSDREYVWHPEYGLDAVGIAPMPDWLMERLAGAQRRGVQPSPAERPARFRWRSVLDGVRAGNRHVSIFLMTSSLRGQGTPEAVAEELALCAARRCRPPFPPAEALAIVADVYGRYRPNAARAAGLSQERIDVMAVLATAGRPLQPAAVADLLGGRREAVKKLMAAMYSADQICRVDGGYVQNLDALTKDRALAPISGGERERRPGAAPIVGRPR
jgi:putative DNA primase/helicase